jgi:hypothetical protein
MVHRHFPVRPNLIQLRQQAKDLLHAIRRSDPDAVADLREHHPKPIDPASVRLADAQLVLARSYGLPSWPRLVAACRMTDALWRGDVDAVRALVLRDPRLLVEDARGVKGNWGPPLSYAANLGHDAIIEMLRGLGATDFEHAFGRACLQGQIETARRLHAVMGSPRPADDELSGPAYTLNVPGTALLLDLGARLHDDQGNRVAPVDVVLETDSRTPAAKHRILELYVEHGFPLPDTPTMALHRGRIDLLEEHLRRDPALLRRTFAFKEIYPPELGCHDAVQATHGTPLAGATLLHMAVDYDEIEIARWLLDRGMNVDQPAAIDADGFGGHTALFSTVVSQPNFWMNHRGRVPEAPFTRLLLDHDANPNARASLRKQVHPGYVENAQYGDNLDGLREFRNVTPVSWGEQFHFKKLVNPAAIQMLIESGGHG